MKVPGFNPLSIGCKNLKQTAGFDESISSMATIPSDNLDFKTARRAG